MHRYRLVTATLVLILGVVLSSCTGDGGDDGLSPSPSSSQVGEAGATASPTPPALPEVPPETRGAASSNCLNGWVTPAAGSKRATQPLDVIRRVTGVRGPLEVVDMRLFDGPESPPSDKGYLLAIRRWYVKAFARNDLAFQGRFLVESRTFGFGLVAVAPYDTEGYRSPDWVGFQFDAGDQEARAHEGLPGLWAGVPYDFVDGGEGLEIPGLPDEVTGCLSGT